MALMVETVRRSGELHDFHLASRKAEELALRRYQAVHWLECFVGPLGINSEPSEREFISCLRNGIVLCNVINKILPGRIPKVVDNNEPVASELSIWDSKPLPAYQYFENVRNFLMAVKELKLPAFEASDLERENFEAEASARIADCILALKSYHEWKEWSGGNGVYKHVTVKSPLALHSSSKNFGRSVNSISAQPCRRLDMSSVDEKQSLTDTIVNAFTNLMVDSKENIHDNFLSSFKNGSQGPVQIFTEILSSCLEEKLRDQSPTQNSRSQDSLGEAGRSCSPLSVLKENLSLQNKPEYSGTQTKKGSRDHWHVLRSQEKELSDIKALWYKTKIEFDDLQSQMLHDLMHIGTLVDEMSAPANGYQKVVQENRKLYNLAQDLKGKVRVYCRIRPIFNAEATNVVDFVGQDGSLVVVDPSKPRSEGRKVFQFNRVYGPTAKQDEVFKEIQPLIRSVMDGYNVCIMAYGQTGSGKTHTMFGSSSDSDKEKGIYFFALNDLFQLSDRRPDVNYDVQVQIVRICNEQMQDLLVEDPSFDGESSLLDASFHSVKSYVDAIKLLKFVEEKDTPKTNNITNHYHSVTTIQVDGKDKAGNIFHGSLYLVELAPSEEDNKSLSCLEEELITSFSQKNSTIHQRSSKISSILKDAFGGNAKVVVFAHMNPEVGNFIETISTLKFTQKISNIELGAAPSNKKNIEVMELKQEIELLKSALGETRPTIEKSPVKARIENPGIMKSEKLAKSPLPKPKTTENPSAREIEKHSNGKSNYLEVEGSNPRPRRLSIENSVSIKPEKVLKSPLHKPKRTENSSTEKTENPRSRRLSIENPLIIKREKQQNIKEHKSPSKGQLILKKQTPIRTRRQSIEKPNSLHPIADIRKSSRTPQTSVCTRRLSIEGPKNLTKESLHSSDVIMEFPMSPPPPIACENGPTFTDCAVKFPSFQLPKTPERQKIESNDMETPGVAKSTTHSKRSQIKRSLRTIGKFINGSEKRNQTKMESSSTKGKGNAIEPKSPVTAKARALRRQSLTGIPAPPGSNRRSSLGGSSTDARSNDSRNARTPPSVRSSTKITGRWM